MLTSTILLMCTLMMVMAVSASASSLVAESVAPHHEAAHCPPGGAIVSFSYMGYVVGLAIIGASAAGAHIAVGKRNSRRL